MRPKDKGAKAVPGKKSYADAVKDGGKNINKVPVPSKGKSKAPVSAPPSVKGATNNVATKKPATGGNFFPLIVSPGL